VIAGERVVKDALQGRRRVARVAAAVRPPGCRRHGHWWPLCHWYRRIAFIYDTLHLPVNTVVNGWIAWRCRVCTVRRLSAAEAIN